MSTRRDPERAQRLSPLQNGVIGSLAGTVEIALQQPMIAVKNAMQQRRPIPWALPVLYRGVTLSLTAIVPINAVRFATNGKALCLLQSESRGTSDGAKIAAGALAGAVGALINTPAELVMTLQQNTGKSFLATINNIVERHGVTRLYRGLEATMVREAVWCASYLALGPVITTRMHNLRPDVFGDADTATLSQRATASAVGSLFAGLLTVYATQPMDTIKTVMQGEAVAVDRHQATSAWGTARRLWYESGGRVGAFYRGSVPRGCRLIGAVFILGRARDWLEYHFEVHGILESSN